MIRLIGFAGAAGSGKSTAALHLVQAHGFVRVRFAGPLKAMMAALGLSDREIDGDDKERPCRLLGGRTPRHAMQTLGTEWGRHLIDSDLWMRAWGRAVDDHLAAGRSVVADDVRFPNEVAGIRDRGGVILRIERPDDLRSSAAGHASEQQSLVTDGTLSNGSSVASLLRKVAGLAGDPLRSPTHDWPRGAGVASGPEGPVGARAVRGLLAERRT